MTKDVAMGLGVHIANKLKKSKLESDEGNNEIRFTIQHGEEIVTRGDICSWANEYFVLNKLEVHMNKDLIAHLDIGGRICILSISNLDRLRRVMGSYLYNK